MKDHKTACSGYPCTCEKSGTAAHTVEVPSGDVAEAFQLAINRAIHDAYQHGYRQGLKDGVRRRPEQAAEMRAEGDERYNDWALGCPPYCTAHNHEEMGG